MDVNVQMGEYLSAILWMLFDMDIRHIMKYEFLRSQTEIQIWQQTPRSACIRLSAGVSPSIDGGVNGGTRDNSASHRSYSA
jgi:hypothetical protein